MSNVKLVGGISAVYFHILKVSATGTGAVKAEYFEPRTFEFFVNEKFYVFFFSVSVGFNRN